ncbi:MAG TPA: ATP phosphoribosyltransferase [Chitinophagales bacterium]|jgi:ATP phosphoribosyltransferase|nr:ATP phosphoribosyltransferase [Chitinophagales bacterium]MBP6155336.1 ATP phosphoribosyltransferase [Chitinophagales bacterium]HQV78782.1 ATP phosphoribosyltransferase [Chitinophagales bacterium]HQW79148.1 ATP phosphoribosyltransferase [Chitinophagales bacterium]HRB67091.1 ATP phosphoribosyltransferase [Chitinophagales bacterium]
MQKLKLAIQKKGRLSEESIKLINECDISFPSSSGKLVTAAYDFPIEILFLRDDDIPDYVQDGVADIGIVGENVLVESAKNVGEVIKMGFGKCRLSLAVPRNIEYASIANLEGKSIATSYPRILQNYLDKNNIKADIHVISGSVEIAPSIGLADAICDIVSTGSTLLSNGLKEVEQIFTSEAVMIKSNHLSIEKNEILNQLLFRLEAVRRAQKNKYILLNAPNKSLDNIISLLPGISSPTVQALAKEGWSSVHSVITEKDFWDKIQKLKDAGAEGILVMPIEKLIY